MSGVMQRVIASGVALLAFAALADEHVVSIRDSLFVPASLTIKVGDTVRWVNNEKRTSHSVLFPGNPSLESERMMPEDAWTRRFDQPGSYPYTCGPHPHMLGSIEVKP
ncbi:MAG: cupredoxin domain-containing protein [Rhodocyclaceae bacterium]|jgi:plastocyanin|nr:cupredoxin domain-containing protein [Rhodocyclaceae bacterium]